jgi:hypothetical protein
VEVLVVAIVVPLALVGLAAAGQALSLQVGQVAREQLIQAEVAVEQGM